MEEKEKQNQKQSLEEPQFFSQPMNRLLLILLPLFVGVLVLLLVFSSGKRGGNKEEAPFQGEGQKNVGVYEDVYYAEQEGKLVAYDKGRLLFQVTLPPGEHQLLYGSSIYCLTVGKELQRLDPKSGKEETKREATAGKKLFYSPDGPILAQTHSFLLLDSNLQVERVLPLSGDLKAILRKEKTLAWIVEGSGADLKEEGQIPSDAAMLPEQSSEKKEEKEDASASSSEKTEESASSSPEDTTTPGKRCHLTVEEQGKVVFSLAATAEQFRSLEWVDAGKLLLVTDRSFAIYEGKQCVDRESLLKPLDVEVRGKKIYALDGNRLLTYELGKGLLSQRDFSFSPLALHCTDQEVYVIGKDHLALSGENGEWKEQSTATVEKIVKDVEGNSYLFYPGKSVKLNH